LLSTILRAEAILRVTRPEVGEAVPEDATFHPVMTRKLIQTTVDAPVCKQLDALARAGGHRRASYLRHLVELHVRALTPELAKITRSTIPLDDLDHLLPDVPRHYHRRGRRK
jgi:hypothetical protein